MDKELRKRIKNRLRTQKHRNRSNQVVENSSDFDNIIQTSDQNAVVNENIDSKNEDMTADESINQFDIESEGESGSNVVHVKNTTSKENVQNLDPDAEADRIKQRLRSWAINVNLPHAHMDKLLEILSHPLIPLSLPRSAKTFLNTTSATYDIRPMESAVAGHTGEFVYFGITEGLNRCIDTVVHTDDVINLQFNIDGLPIFKSSNIQFWPILCKVYHQDISYKPFPVAIYSGPSKPKDCDDYLSDFVEEITNLQINGIQIKEKLYQVKIHCFICDMPARSFIKGIKGHNGYSACERCTVYGEREQNRTVYLSVNDRERTNENFRNMEYPDHHARSTLLLNIHPPLDMIFQFILDMMHLGFLGAMKKMIDYWMTGDFNIRLGRRQKIEISRRIELLKSQIPYEFQRKIRSINLYNIWKATEYRFFLLYCGPIVLKNILNPNLYKHFLLFHSACRILCSPGLAISHNSYAKSYLRTFFITLKDFYGKKSASLKMHSLIHLADDVLHANCHLSDITSFPFENLLGEIKKSIRSSKKPIAQVCRRLHERHILNLERPVLKSVTEILVENERIKFKDFLLTAKTPNNIVILKNRKVLQICKILTKGPSIFIEGKIWKVKKSMYEYPFDSSILDLFELQKHPSEDLVTYRLDEVERKLVKLCINFQPEGQIRNFIIPILH